MGRSTPENTQCDIPPTLPNRRGAKRIRQLPCHVHIGSYLLILGHLLLDSIRDLGETAKEKWLNSEIKALQSLALGGSGGQSRANASNTCKVPSFSRKVTWITGKLGTI